MQEDAPHPRFIRQVRRRVDQGSIEGSDQRVEEDFKVNRHERQDFQDKKFNMVSFGLDRVGDLEKFGKFSQVIYDKWSIEWIGRDR
jgi:hypothetical protein